MTVIFFLFFHGQVRKFRWRPLQFLSGSTGNFGQHGSRLNVNFVEYFSVAAGEDSGGSNRSRSELEQQSSAFFFVVLVFVLFLGGLIYAAK